MKRPELSRALTPEQFQENYYLKEELQAFLKACGVTCLLYTSDAADD